MLPLANGAIGYLVGTSIAVIGLYILYAIPICPAAARRAAIQARSMEPRMALPVDRHPGGHLDSARLRVVPAARVPARHSRCGRVRLECRELRSVHRRRRPVAVRWLVPLVGSPLVHRTGAAAGAGARPSDPQLISPTRGAGSVPPPRHVRLTRVPPRGICDGVDAEAVGTGDGPASYDFPHRAGRSGSFRPTAPSWPA